MDGRGIAGSRRCGARIANVRDSKGLPDAYRMHAVAAIDLTGARLRRVEMPYLYLLVESPDAVGQD